MAIDQEFLRSIHWAATPIGPMEGWPQSLKSYVDMILGLPTPAIVFWGPEQTQIYNEGYAAIMGPRHPRYFGGTYRECWPETYPILIAPMREVLESGGHFEVARAPITMTRHGFPEEAFFTFTFSPLRDDAGAIQGVYQPVIELTTTVLHERRSEQLRLLTARHDGLPSAFAGFQTDPSDLPLAVAYLWDERRQRLRIEANAGLTSDACEASLAQVGDAIGQAFATNTALEVELGQPVVAGPWPEPVRRLFLAPIRRSVTDEPYGVLAFGISPRLRFDAGYRDFFEAVTREIASSVAAHRAQQAENDWLAREQASRAEAEAAKEASARRMSSLFEHAPVGIGVLRGPEHVFEVANPQYAALVGHRPLLHKPIRVALPELEGQGIFELLDRVFATGEPFLGRSVRLVVDRPEGGAEERFFDFVYEPMPGEDGKTESIIVIVFEVTELAKARRQAEAANRAKDEFFAVLGHELRNPLAPITTALQLMRLRGDTTLVKERTIIERQVGQISRLVDDLLDVSRVTRGKVALERAPLELSDVVAKAIEMASPLFEQRHHHLEVDVAPRGLVVEGDAGRLAQVVSNLLANAAKYTEPGGKVRVSASRSDERIALRVADSGIGIAPDMLPRVFDAFAQEQQALDRSHGGLGLGLTIADNLVKLHGGTISAHSAGRGQGSTFTVLLPASTVALTRAEAAPSPVPRRAPDALRVLVVDDNQDAAAMLAEALVMLGHDTRVAHDGAEAVRAAAELVPDVALLDIGLPVMDGYELAAQLRSAARERPLRLVAVTGYGQESDRRRAAEAGFDAHLVKPVKLEAVATLIEGYRAAIRSPSRG